MILVCDLGNTNVVFAMYENDECLLSFRLISSKLMDKDEYIAKLNNIINDMEMFSASITSSKAAGIGKMKNTIAASKYNATPIYAFFTALSSYPSLYTIENHFMIFYCRVLYTIASTSATA